ncbi:hypothetical protein P8C59_005291 [Phyllachora maydis]|uniref:Uncharacterized protein n=1 Tax=Phyllachora maydis TaxID=1825666 RepID=A0AAD9I576_9PEZI|nr:hypothetical protein P8C59_005291 [Phyllachora maydis]
MPAKLAKITPAIHRTAAYKAKRRDNAGRYTTNSSLMANKDNNNAYNRAYMPLTNIEEEEDGSSDNNSVNSSTSNSTNKGKGSSAYKYGKGALRCKDILLYKRQCIASYLCGPSIRPIMAYYLKVLTAFKPTSA